jgi:hypothetical protein
MLNVTHAQEASQAAGFAEPGPTALPPRRLGHPALVRSLQRAYSAERAASFAYIGHAASLRDPQAKAAIKQIEEDEWAHRRHVLAIMQQHAIPVSRRFELQYYVIGKLIGASCHVIGWFMPYFFAGKLESGNVCEYFVMLRHFRSLGIRDHDAILYEMGMKEKEHEVFFLAQVQQSRLLPLFEALFSWGSDHTRNDVDLDAKYRVEDSHLYCQKAPEQAAGPKLSESASATTRAP